MEYFFEWILESSLLVLMILGIRKIFMGRIRYAGIYALWIVVLLRFMIPVNFISTPFSVGNIFSDAVSSWTPIEISEQNSEASASLGANPQQETEIGEVSDTDSGIKEAGKKQIKYTKTQTEKETLQQDTSQTQKGTFPAFIKIKDINWRFIFGRGWLVISGILFLWLIMSNVCLIRKIKQNRIFYERRNKVNIYVASEIKNPCLYGFFKPAIYLPKALLSSDGGVRADQEELEQMITHEYVHYQHRDHIWAMLRMLLVSVYWFDPFLWLAVSYSKKDAELFCDETVIRLLGEEKRFSYGEMLVRLAGDTRWGDFRYSMMPMSRRGKEMEKRIRAISTRRTYSKWVLIPLVVTVSIAVGVTCSTGIGPLAKVEKATNKAKEESVASGAALSSTGEGKRERDSEQTVEKQISIYSDFLNACAEDTKYRYYSLAWLEEDHVVLLVSSKVSANNAEKWGSNACEIYNIVKDQVAFCGNVACSSSSVGGIRLSDGKVWSNTQYAISKTWVQAEENELSTETAENAMQNSNDESSDYAKWLNEFEQASGIAFYMSPYTAKRGGEGEPEVLALQNNVSYYLADAYREEEEGTVAAATYEEAFQRYIETFTEAVNTGNVDKMSQVLAVGSDVYEQQCALAKNYYKRGIREEIKSCSISSTKMIASNQVGIHSREVIKVFYADATKKIIKQQYLYTCEYINGNWIITKMSEIKS